MMLRPRNRLVYCRVSDDEFQKLNELCQSGGVRSISDVVRSGLKQVIESPANSESMLVHRKLDAVHTTLTKLEQSLREVIVLINTERPIDEAVTTEDKEG